MQSGDSVGGAAVTNIGWVFYLYDLPFTPNADHTLLQCVSFVKFVGKRLVWKRGKAVISDGEGRH